MGLWKCEKCLVTTHSRHKKPACPKCHKKERMIELQTVFKSNHAMNFRPLKAAISGPASSYFGKKYEVKT